MRFLRDDLFKVVCMLYTPTSVNSAIVGTGNFIEKDGRPYLVTAEHVQRDITDNTMMFFGESNSAFHVVKLKDLISGSWNIHPKADLAAIQFDITKFNDDLKGRFFPFSQISTTPSNPSRDVELTVVGFPQGLGLVGANSIKKFSPLTFRNFPASGLFSFPLSRPDTTITTDFFALENAPMGGFSGGPVLDLGYRKTPLMQENYGDTIIKGFICGALPDDGGDKLGLITPSYFLSGII